MKDPELTRVRQHLAGLAGPARPREDCAGAAEIWDAARGECDPGRSRELLDHTLACPVCAETWRLARQVASRATEARRGAPRRRWVGLAAAAAAVLLVALLAPRFGDRGVRSPVLREETGYGIRSLTSPQKPQPRSDLLLEWSPGPPGTLYAVEVSTIDFERIHRVRRLAQARYRVPPEALQTVPDGALLLWRVEARLADGSIVRSPAFRAAVE